MVWHSHAKQARLHIKVVQANVCMADEHLSEGVQEVVGEFGSC